MIIFTISKRDQAKMYLLAFQRLHRLKDCTNSGLIPSISKETTKEYVAGDSTAENKTRTLSMMPSIIFGDKSKPHKWDGGKKPF